MRRRLINRLLVAVLGLGVVAFATSKLSADSCGTIAAYNLCPNNCDQSHCNSWCSAAGPGCVASESGHECNDTTCWCDCEYIPTLP